MGSPGSKGSLSTRQKLLEAEDCSACCLTQLAPRYNGNGEEFILRMWNSAHASSFTLFTSIEELIGYEEKFGGKRPAGVTHGENVGRESWADRRHREKNFINTEPTVVIVGAGQAGLNLAAHLGQLDIPTLIIDKNDRIGDNWRKRYRFLVLHDPVWYDHMSYIPFPDNWPVFTPKDKLADWFESYAASMELNVWMKTELKGADFDEKTHTWTVPVKQPDGTLRNLHPKRKSTVTRHSHSTDQVKTLCLLQDILVNQTFRLFLVRKNLPEKYAIHLSTPPEVTSKA